MGAFFIVHFICYLPTLILFFRMEFQRKCFYCSIDIFSLLLVDRFVEQNHQTLHSTLGNKSQLEFLVGIKEQQVKKFVNNQYFPTEIYIQLHKIAANKRQRIPKRQSKCDQSRETGNIGYTRQRHNTICVGHHNMQTNTNNVSKA